MKFSHIFTLPAISALLALSTLPAFVSAATLSPVTMELEGTRGEILNSHFTLINVEQTSKEYFFDSLSFQAKDTSGTPEFFESEKQMSNLEHWISFQTSSAIVPAFSKIEIPFSISIPNDISAGGYYAAITASPAPADIVADNGALIEAKTAILVFLTISGETIESLALLDFTSSSGSSDLLLRDFEFRVQNQGNVHVTPLGSVALTGIFGQTIEKLDANPVAGRVLPGMTRLFEVTHEKENMSWFETASYQARHALIGPVTATLELSNGDQQTFHSELMFWIFPWELIVTVVAIILVISSCIFVLWRLNASKYLAKSVRALER